MKCYRCLLPAFTMVLFLSGCTVDINVTPKEHRENIITDEQILEIAGKARMINPWGETQSISVAEEWAGVDFYPPSEEIALSDGSIISLTTYRYMTGIAEALYRSDDHELVFRQSHDVTGAELAGDHYSYSVGYDAKINGQTVHCLGDSQTINLAYWDASGDHFSISFNSGEEGKGLSEADLAVIIKDIRNTATLY